MASHEYDYFIFSYHGVPECQIRRETALEKTVTLAHAATQFILSTNIVTERNAMETTRLMVKELGLKEGTYLTTFNLA